MTFFKTSTLAGAAMAVIATAALAADTSDFINVTTIDIEDFIGTVEIKTGNQTNVSVLKTDGANAAYPVRMDAKSGTLTIQSDEDPDRTRWWDEVSWRKHHENAFKIFLEDYPTIVITAPKGTALSFDSAVVQLGAGDTNGALKVSGGYVEGEIGDVETADIKIDGSAHLRIGDVAQELGVMIRGSGDVIAGTVKTAAINIQGSGDVTVGDVDGSAQTRIRGSGDVQFGGIDGAATFQIGGSGDIKTGDIKEGADVSINGSGDVILASVNGATTVSVHGSGDTRINGGRSQDLKVRVHGSGEFRHQGVAVNPDIAVYGSGDVYVADYEGNIRTSGDGDIRIAGRNYGD